MERLSEETMQYYLLGRNYHKDIEVSRDEFLEDDGYMFDGAVAFGWKSVFNHKTQTYSFKRVDENG